MKQPQLKWIFGILAIWIFCFSLLSASPKRGCQEWTSAKKIGRLDPKVISESSGVALSRQFPNRMYHINDSGDGGFFYVTNRKGKLLQKVEVKGLTPTDMEDLSLGPCGEDTCLFLADIGDNLRIRKTIEIIVIKEQKKFPSQVDAWRRVRLRYPDQAHNAESFAVHPKGDFFILTKEENLKKREAYSAVLFRLSAQSWRKAQGSNALTLQYQGKLDLPYLLYESGFFGRLATAMDFSPEGDRWMVLTYENVLEFFSDLTEKGALKPGSQMLEERDYRVIPLKRLHQQEALAYFPNGKGFVYSTEFTRGGPTPLMKVSCKK